MYLFSITMKEYHLSGFVISYFLDWKMMKGALHIITINRIIMLLG